MGGQGLNPLSLGGSENVGAEEHETTTTEQVDIGDDEKVFLGDDQDFSIRFDSSATQCIVRDENNDKDIVVFDDDNATDALQVNGRLDANGSQGGTGLNVDKGRIFVDNGNRITLTSGGVLEFPTEDVRNISSPNEGWYADHDGSGTNTEGLARFDGSDWISQVDGSTIS